MSRSRRAQPRLTEDLEALLGAQVERLRSMERLSRAIVDSADRHDEPESIMSLLAERQAMLFELSDGAREIESARGGSAALDPTVAARVDRLEAAASAIVERIREFDDRARRAMERQRESMTRELAELGRAQRAVTAYGTGGAPGARFEDRHG